MTPLSIVTLTMNTALDVAADADEVVPTEKVRCRAVRYDAGGGGVNVARFARVLGATVSAVFSVRSPTSRGSPIIPVAPPASTIGRCPACWNRRRVSSGIRCPACRLGAVGSKPE